jgi:hypothetical protein
VAPEMAASSQAQARPVQARPEPAPAAPAWPRQPLPQASNRVATGELQSSVDDELSSAALRTVRFDAEPRIGDDVASRATLVESTSSSAPVRHSTPHGDDRPRRGGSIAAAPPSGASSADACGADDDSSEGLLLRLQASGASAGLLSQLRRALDGQSAVS